jgi:hypothetical protein
MDTSQQVESQKQKGFGSATAAAAEHRREATEFFGSTDDETQHRVVVDFHPTAMAITSSGKTIVVGHRPDLSPKDDQKYGGAVLDADDHIVKSFELPLPPGGGGWTVAGSRMAVGDGVARVCDAALERAAANGDRDDFGSGSYRYHDRRCAVGQRQAPSQRVAFRPRCRCGGISPLFNCFDSAPNCSS